MSFRVGRFAKARWRAGKRIYRRHIAKHRRAVVVGLLVLVVGGLVLARIPARHSERPPGSDAARPVATPVFPGEPVAAPEMPAQPPRPTEEAALRPPPALPPPPAVKPAWLRYAVPAQPTGNRPLVAIVFDETKRNPLTVMPPFGRNRILTEKEINAVVDFLQTL